MHHSSRATELCPEVNYNDFYQSQMRDYSVQNSVMNGDSKQYTSNETNFNFQSPPNENIQNNFVHCNVFDSTFHTTAHGKWMKYFSVFCPIPFRSTTSAWRSRSQQQLHCWTVMCDRGKKHSHTHTYASDWMKKKKSILIHCSVALVFYTFCTPRIHQK